MSDRFSLCRVTLSSDGVAGEMAEYQKAIERSIFLD
jgi:hypothetical protein